VVDILALCHVCVRVLRCAPVTIIAPMLHIVFNLDTAYIRRTSGRNGGTVKQEIAVSELEEHRTEITSFIYIYIYAPEG
jgi:hypothetical protein